MEKYIQIFFITRLVFRLPKKMSILILILAFAIALAHFVQNAVAYSPEVVKSSNSIFSTFKYLNRALLHVLETLFLFLATH